LLAGFYLSRLRGATPAGRMSGSGRPQDLS